MFRQKIPKSRLHFPMNRKFSRDITVLKFLINALSRSSVGGLCYIASSRSGWRKFLWTIVLASCLGGFSFQAFSFARTYHSRPTVVEINIENSGESEFPSITICNYNRIRKSQFCKYYSEYCNNGKETVFLDDKLMAEIRYQSLLKNQTGIMTELGHSKDIILSCIFKGSPSLGNEECIKRFLYSYDPEFGNCYTFLSRDSEGHPLLASEADFWQEANDLALVLDTEPHEFMESSRDQGIIITLHSWDTYPDVHTDGVVVESGNSYSLGVSQAIIKLLQLPYKTNCTDFNSLPWKKQGRRFSSRLCTVGCSQYFQLKDCKYVTRYLSLFFEHLPWNPNSVNNASIECAQQVEERTKEYCRSLCGVPCIDNQYEVTLSTNKLTERELLPYDLREWKNKSWDLKIESLAFVRIFFKTLEKKIFQHTPKYNTFELFSYLGGYSGVWLGFSLLTVYELLEILFATAKFAFKKNLQKLRKTKVATALVFNNKKFPRKFRRGFIK